MSLSLIEQVIDNFVLLLAIAIIIRAFLSFLPHINNKFTMLLDEVTEPLLRPFRRFQIGGPSMALDLSPVFAIIALNVLAWVIKVFLRLLF